MRSLPGEQELARELVQSLELPQRQQAVIATQSFGDILTGPIRSQTLKSPVGLPLSEMDEGRRARAMCLIEEYINRLLAEVGKRSNQLIA